MDVTELAPGLWRWTAPHPAWTPDQGGDDGWGPEVASYYCEARGSIVLVDPVVPSEEDDRERFWRALDRDAARLGTPAVVLTCAWHARSSRDVLDRYPGAAVWVHADGAAELEQHGDGEINAFREGEPLPGGAVAIGGVVGVGEVIVWLPVHGALVAGDTLLGGGPVGVRLCPDAWLSGDPAAVTADLRHRLAGVPVERVLPTHGAPLILDARRALDQVLDPAHRDA